MTKEELRSLLEESAKDTARLDNERLALKEENWKLQETLKDTVAHLVAAVSLLKSAKRFKKAAPSDTMFDMMVEDYERSIQRGRDALK